MDKKQLWRAICICLGTLIVLSGLGGCVLGSHPVTQNLVVTTNIPTPTGLFSNVAWVTPEKLVVTYQKSRNERPDQLWEVGVDGRNLQLVSLEPSNHKCRDWFYEPKRVQEAKLSYVRLCKDFNTFGEQYLFARDMETRKSELLRPYVLPNHYLRTSMSPDLSRGIVGEDTSIQENLYWLNQDDAERIDIGFDRATEPAWSPDNKTIVFFGNKSVGGEPGPAWAGKPYDLWKMPANCDTLQGGCKENVTLLVSNIYNQTAVNWSPDSRWIVFDGDLQGRGQGLWLRNMQSGEIIQIQKGKFRNPSFSPNGKQIVAIAPAPGDNNPIPETTQLYILDVSEIVSK